MEKIVVVISSRSNEEVKHLEQQTVSGDAHTTFISGTSYWVVHHDGYAGLIDPASLNANFVSSAITDFKVARAAYQKKDDDFSVIKRCPAFMDIVFSTLDLASLQGISEVHLEPEISVVLKTLDDRTITLRASARINRESEKIKLNAFEISTLRSQRNPSTILPFQYTIYSLELVATEFRQPLEEKMFKRFWELRNEMDQEYRAAYQNLAGALATNEPTKGELSNLKGNTIGDLSKQERALIFELMRTNSILPNEWQDATITDVTARLSLQFAVHLNNGKVFNSSFRMAHGLY